MASSIRKLTSVCLLALVLSSCATEKKNRAQIYELANEISDLRSFNDSALGREEKIVQILSIQNKTMGVYLDIFKAQRDEIKALEKRVDTLEHPSFPGRDYIMSGDGEGTTHIPTFIIGDSGRAWWPSDSIGMDSVTHTKPKMSIKHSKHK